MAAASSAAAGAQPAANRPLLGAEGIEFVSHTLSTKPPLAAVAEIQQRCALADTGCGPLLGMLDVLGVSRASAHLHVLKSARGALLEALKPFIPRRDDGRPDAGAASGSAGTASAAGGAAKPAASSAASAADAGGGDAESARLEAAARHDAALLPLLERTWPYLGIAELRCVPVRVLECMHAVPPAYLRLLCASKEVFEALPAAVKRQAWEHDVTKLQNDAVPEVGAYKYETATVMRALHMDEFLSTLVGRAAVAPGGGVRPAPTPLPRRTLRRGSQSLKALRDMVGGSQKVYSSIVNLIVSRYRDGEGLYISYKDTSYCTLRAQLIMFLHGDGLERAVERWDPAYLAAWTLDAAVGQAALSDAHLKAIRASLEKQGVIPSSGKAAPGRKGAGSAPGTKPAAGVKRRRRDSDDWEPEAGGGGDDDDNADASRNTAQAAGSIGMVLRDPSAMHVLLTRLVQELLAEAGLSAATVPSNATVPAGAASPAPGGIPGRPAAAPAGRPAPPMAGGIAGLLAAVKGQPERPAPPPPRPATGAAGSRAAARALAADEAPADRGETVAFVLQLLQLAVESRSMLRDKKAGLPPPPEPLQRQLWPLLVQLLRAAAAPFYESGRYDPGAEPPAALLPILRGWEVARKLVQMLALERLVRGDLRTGGLLLRALSASLSVNAVPEHAAFGASLAQRLGVLLKAGKVVPGDALWSLAFDLLVRLVDSHTQTHEEILRLLQDAVGRLPPPVVAGYLRDMLANSRASRNHFAVRMNKINRIQSVSQLPLDAYLSAGSLSALGTDLGSDGWRGIAALKQRGADGVKHMYERFTRVPALDEATAPELHAYLRAKESKESKESKEKDKDRDKERDREKLQVKIRLPAATVAMALQRGAAAEAPAALEDLEDPTGGSSGVGDAAGGGDGDGANPPAGAKAGSRPRRKARVIFDEDDD